MQLHLRNGNIDVVCGNTVLLYLCFFRVQVTLIAMVRALLFVGFATVSSEHCNPQCMCFKGNSSCLMCKQAQVKLDTLTDSVPIISESIH